MMANTQAILLMTHRISKLADENNVTLSQIALTKAWVTERGREVCKLGREICGGNGLLHENYVMRAMADMEAAHTYEGTYEINSLIAGRELTGLSSFTK
jgi:acyl-CoA oxidase